MAMRIARKCVALCWLAAAADYKLLQDTDFYGSNIPGGGIVDSADACAKVCLANARCASASWNGPDRQYKDKNCNLHCRGDNPSKDKGEVGILVDAGNRCSMPPTPTPPPAPILVPEDLRASYERGDLLYTSNEAAVRYRPEVGNGFVATVVGSNDLFAAGVFNGCFGCKSADPSHRARIPDPLSLKLTGSVIGAALDIRNAAYLRRYIIDGGAMAQLRFIAHRARRSLLVVELSLLNGTSGLVDVQGAGQNPSSSDFNWVVSQRTVGSHSITVWSGETKDSELATSNRTRVAVVFDAHLGGKVTLAKDQSISYVAAVRTSLESSDAVEEAVADWLAAASRSAEELYSEHTSSWAELWQSGFEVAGRMDVARAVNSSLYYLLSSVREDTTHSLSPGGLASNGYNGHSFWDCETWMYPSTVLWHPNLAASLLQYRIDRVSEAENKARSYEKGYVGAMFPWESAATGSETCPSWAATGKSEQHITGDVAFAAQQLWYAQRNETWLRLAYPGLLRKTADFWVSRVETDTEGVAHIKNVIPPDEYAKGDDSVYTNYVAQRNLLFAAEAAKALGTVPASNWTTVAEKLPILFDKSQSIHPEYDGYHGQKIKQADVVLLGFPLMMEMSPEVRRADLEYYAPRTDGNGPAMTWGMHAVGFIELGDDASVGANFNRSFANAQQPFLVWTETPEGGAVNFLTGVGGFLQTILFGLPGLRIWPDHLALKPYLVEGMTAVTIRNVHYQGAVMTVMYDSKATTIRVSAGAAVAVTNEDKTTVRIAAGQSKTFTPGSLVLRSGRVHHWDRMAVIV